MGARNAAEVLPRALHSLEAQTYDDWECVIVDDGSEDDTARIASSYRRVRVVSQRAAGLTEALRAGCREARGALIARLDADDEASPDRLAKQAAAFDADQGLVALGCAVELRSESGAAMGRRAYPVEHDAIVERMGALLTPIPHSSLMARAEAISAVGGYRAEFRKAQDYDLLLRLSAIGRLGNLSETPVTLSVSSKSMTASVEGGEQLRFGALALACEAVRKAAGADPLAGPEHARFLADFDAWYAGSRLPGMFHSRLAGREARAALAERHPWAAAAALARMIHHDPYRLIPGSLGDKRAADEVKAWADAWARRPR